MIMLRNQDACAHLLLLCIVKALYLVIIPETIYLHILNKKKKQNVPESHTLLQNEVIMQIVMQKYFLYHVCILLRIFVVLISELHIYEFNSVFYA